MYKVPSSEAQSMFERHPNWIRWGIFLLLFVLLMYVVFVILNVGFNVMDYRDADRAAWGKYASNDLRLLDLLIWFGLMISPLIHRFIIRKMWFLKRDHGGNAAVCQLYPDLDADVLVVQ